MADIIELKNGELLDIRKTLISIGMTTLIGLNTYFHVI